MKKTMIEKARSNRNAALEYVEVQRAKLMLLTGFRDAGPRRAPFPTFGFSSSRTASPEAVAA